MIRIVLRKQTTRTCTTSIGIGRDLLKTIKQINQPINDIIQTNQTINQSMNQSINQQMNESNTQIINQSTKQQFKQLNQNNASTNQSKIHQ